MPAQAIDYADKSRIPSDDEKSIVKIWFEKIKAAEDDNSKRFDAWRRNRRLYEGVASELSTETTTRTNLIFATIATILPQVYAKAPEIAVTPAKSVGDDRYEIVKQFCGTMESVLGSALVRKAKLKRRGKSAVRSAMITPMGWMKLVFRKDRSTDPAMMTQVQDAQDNLNKLQASMRLVKDGDVAGEELTRREQEMKDQLAALQSRTEVWVKRGLVIDRPLTEDILVLDPTIKDPDAYQNASAIAHRLWYTKDSFEREFGYSIPDGATEYRRPSTDEAEGRREGSGPFFQVFEIWAKDKLKVEYVCTGCPGFIREPLQPKTLGERWYPFFQISFNPVDGKFYGTSDVELLAKLCDEYNETRDNWAQHRQDNRAINVVRAGGTLTPDDVNRIVNAKRGDTVVVTGPSGKPLSDDMFSFDGVPINAANYVTDPIRADIEWVSGAGDAARGGVAKAKTATEAEIMQQGLSSRTEERRDQIEDTLQEMAIYAAEILLQELTLEDVQRIAGAEAQWPQLDKEGIFSLVEIEIRAGSTGRPNQARDRDQWTNLLPIIKEAMQSVAELRAQGSTDMADCVINLVKETLRRFDERVDLDQFIPRGAGQQGDPTQELASLKQKLAQMQQAMQELQGEADKNKTQLAIADKDAETRKQVALIDAAANFLIKESAGEREMQKASMGLDAKAAEAEKTRQHQGEQAAADRQQQGEQDEARRELDEQALEERILAAAQKIADQVLQSASGGAAMPGTGPSLPQ